MAFDGPVRDGRPTRVTSTGAIAPRHPHYTDDRVLIAGPSAPRGVVLFFHGQMGAVDRDAGRRWDLPGQAAAAGWALVAPQLGRDVADSHPGKLAKPGAAARLMAAAAPYLDDLAGQETADLPVVLCAFSGGWRASGAVLAGGGLDHRIAGVILLDALFGGIDGLVAWCGTGAGWLVALSGGRCADGHAALARSLDAAGIVCHRQLPHGLGCGTVALLDTGRDHWDVPGPPDRPIRAILRRMEPG